MTSDFPSKRQGERWVQLGTAVPEEQWLNYATYNEILLVIVAFLRINCSGRQLIGYVRVIRHASSTEEQSHSTVARSGSMFLLTANLAIAEDVLTHFFIFSPLWLSVLLHRFTAACFLLSSFIQLSSSTSMRPVEREATRRQYFRNNCPVDREDNNTHAEYIILQAI